MIRFRFTILIFVFSFFNLSGQGFHDPVRDGIKILAIGNSYSQDAMQYMNNLLIQLGVAQNRIKLVNAYIGGGSLQDHANKDRSGEYIEIQSFGAIGMPWAWGILRDIIRQDQWDIITLQQASSQSGNSATYNADLDYLIKLVKDNAPNAKLGWHMTWAWANGYNGINQNHMYSTICNAVIEKIVPNWNFRFIIPTGTAIQNARGHFGDVLNSDGTHLNSLGCYVAATMWIKTITGYDISGLTMPNKEHIVQFVNAAHAIPFNTTPYRPSYTVTFNPNGGTVYPASGTTNFNGRLANLPWPSKTAYDFTGWFTQATGGAQVTIDWEYNANTTIYAQWTPTTYRIDYYLNGGTQASNPQVGYNILTPGVPLPIPTRTGYTFDGWYDNPYLAGDAVTDIPAGGTGHRSFWAKWTLIDYTITYNLDGGVALSDNPAIYNYETSTFTLHNPDKTGYTFSGWTGSNGTTPQTTVTIAQGSTDNRNYTANWSLIAYTIAYELDNGTNHNSNPTSYDHENQGINLHDPTRTGYTFVGWFDSDTGGNRVTSIPTGSTGDITLWARWSLITYTIAYELDGGTNHNSNPGTYDVTHPAITLHEPARTGYSFNGWFDRNTGGNRVTSIPSGSTGDITIWARWTLITYSITYILDGGTNKVSNPRSYNVTYPAITLDDPARSGYSFDGWFDRNTGGNRVTSIPSGSTGDITLWARWSLITYTITYHLDSGTNHYSNPTGYDATSPTITLHEPTRTNYRFDGWFDSSTGGDRVISIPSGSTGDITLWARWTLLTVSPELAPANPLKAWMHNGLLHITGLIPGEKLNIFNANGALIYQTIVVADEMDIPLSVQGVYIVRAGDRTVRVAFQL